MILTKQVENEAVLSNVGATTDFKIKATAKSFRILADGLYSNKIRAIVRELSCNAYDSHVAAGRPETPFDVHLPNQLEPFFSIRDYGVGLSDEEVTNIFTTFFESTKTGSNDFVGALGLGSKSPFSYTDSFTVTAIKHGIKGVYTAFINDHGVPSIAMMAQEETTDPAGVEIRFAVEDQWHFGKFCQEAIEVFQTFKHKPVVSGNSRFKFEEFDYETRDVIPGVHVLKSSRYSTAIMGNIGYPINIPDSDKTLSDDLRGLIRCGLVMEFAIGELDFQASREGLSYIPQTVQAIKSKLEQLRDQLVVHVAAEADKIENIWERAYFLMNKARHDLWRAATAQYVQNTKLDVFQNFNGYNLYPRDINIKVDDLASQYNITVKAFDSDYRSRCSSHTPRSVHNPVTQNYDAAWQFVINERVKFVIQDTKTGAAERAKHHWRNKNVSERVYVLAPTDKTKAMDTDSFFAAIMNPPQSQICLATSLDEKPRKAGMAKNVSIMRLERRGGRSNSEDMVWRAAGKLSDFSKSETHYYLPIKGFESLGKVDNVKALTHYMSNAKIGVPVFGVRKADLTEVESMKNWVHLDEYVVQELKKFGNDMVMGLVKSAIDFSEMYKYNVYSKLSADSPYLKLHTEFKDVKKVDDSVRYAVEWLCKQYDVTTNTNIDITATVTKYKQEEQEHYKRYPLTQYLRYAPDQDVANYINMIDNFNNQKGE